jgi:hypothetical protein
MQKAKGKRQITVHCRIKLVGSPQRRRGGYDRMSPGCCRGIGMGVTPTMNTHKGNMGIAVPCSRREHRAILPERSSFREPGALWANRTVETARLVYKSNRNAIGCARDRLSNNQFRICTNQCSPTPPGNRRPRLAHFDTLWHVRRGGFGDAITILSGAADG